MFALPSDASNVVLLPYLRSASAIMTTAQQCLSLHVSGNFTGLRIVYSEEATHAGSIR